MLETVNEKVCNFLQIVRRKRGVANWVVTIATAKVLIAKSDFELLKTLDPKISTEQKAYFEGCVL